jgi:hypothetical protein
MAWRYIAAEWYICNATDAGGWWLAGMVFYSGFPLKLRTKFYSETFMGAMQGVELSLPFANYIIQVNFPI